jgi:hypothetical protein
MKRLIIIGNGFDLAHGLPTKYSDFLEWYWSKLNLIKPNLNRRYVYEDGIINFNFQYPFNTCKSLESFKTYLKDYNYKSGSEYKYENTFFIQLNQSSLINWVDIEMFYKQKLEDLFNAPNPKPKIEKLNTEFSIVKELFEKYLNEVVKPLDINQNINSAFYKIINCWQMQNNFSAFFVENMPQHLYKNREFRLKLNNDKFSENEGGTYILNFNYTDTVKKYISEKNSVYINHIHGSYNNFNEDIVFGYGDESDELFSKIENSNENSYLKHTKSVNYLRYKNYTNLLNFINSDNFIVEVMGHSLALSDRTLLKTIFENEKCQYIFMYYHKRKDGTTDYFDKSVNISRHFSDKILMRKKVAPEVFCCPLPQHDD